MTNEEFTLAVDHGEFPTFSSVPKATDDFRDARGAIINVLRTPITSVALIESKAGTVRANHYHRTDWHYAYVVSGEVAYFERPIDSEEIGQPLICKSGDTFFTPPNREHAMLFTIDTVIMTFAKNIRTHDNHEADLVRVEYVTPEIARRYLP